MITRVLFVDNDANALDSIKRALERAGDYEAAVFTTGRAAWEYAVQHPPDVAVVALDLRDVDPADLVAGLRRQQPHLAVILRAAPDTEEKRLQSLNPQGVLRKTYAARTLIDLIEQALPRDLPDGEPPRDKEHDTRDVPVTDSPAVRQYLATSEIDEDAAAFGEVLQALGEDTPAALEEVPDDTFDELVKSLGAPVEKPPLPERHRQSMARLVEAARGHSADDDADAVFKRLAAEEPPMPTLEDTGTVRDLIAITDPDLLDTPAPEGKVIPDELIEEAVEASAGEATEDDALPETASEAVNHLTAMLKAVETPAEPGDASEIRQAQRELLDALFAAHESAPGGSPDDEASRETDSPELMTMPEELRLRFEDYEPEPDDEATPVPAPPSRKPAPLISEEAIGPLEIAMLAVRLTHYTSESSAQATILIQNNVVVTSAGALPDPDVEALAAMVDSDAVLKTGKLQIKFASLSQTRINYLIVATPTVDEMVLAMVFTEDMPLGSIRKQAKEMVDVLRAAPEPPSRPAPPAPDELPETPSPEPSEELLPVYAESDEYEMGLTETLAPEGEDAEALVSEVEDGDEARLAAREAVESAPALDPATLAKYACAWILRDPDATLDADLTKALPRWLDQIIAQQHWLAEQIDVQPHYISTVISVPPAETPAQVVRVLMNETSQRIKDSRPDFVEEPGALWADAYYVMAPGRALTSEEIEDFIRYQRED